MTFVSLIDTYTGAFVYARTPELPPVLMPIVSKVARENGLDPTKFCKIRNTCFKDTESLLATNSRAKLPSSNFALAGRDRVSSWFPGWHWMAQLSGTISQEFSDWFEDPSKTSDWLIGQQERMILTDDPNLIPNSLQDLLATKIPR